MLNEIPVVECMHDQMEGSILCMFWLYIRINVPAMAIGTGHYTLVLFERPVGDVSVTFFVYTSVRADVIGLIG
jgi:hypothetical protein